MNVSIVDVSSVLGLFALITLTINFLLGLMLSTGYRRSAYWKRLPITIKKVNITQTHNWTAYVALVLILLHPFLLLLDRSTRFSVADIVLPFHAGYQTFWVSFGVLSLYAVVLVIITSQKRIKRRLGFRLWKNIHLVSYATALLMCLHGIFLDPELKNHPPDFFDGEKLICEACLLVLFIAGIARIRMGRRAAME